MSLLAKHVVWIDLMVYQDAHDLNPSTHVFWEYESSDRVTWDSIEEAHAILTTILSYSMYFNKKNEKKKTAQTRCSASKHVPDTPKAL